MMKGLVGLIILFVALFLFVQYPTHISDRLTELNYSLSGCAGLSEKDIIKSRSFFGEDYVNFTVKAENIMLEQGVNHACCLDVNMSMEKSGSQIILKQEFVGEPCKCMCHSTLNSTIGPLSSGSYDIILKGIVNKTQSIIIK